MRPANISTLKAQLTKYLRFARSGEEVMVLDRNAPIARIIPWTVDDRPRLSSRKPAASFQGLKALQEKPVKGPSTDSLAFLLEDRRSR